MNDGRTSGNDGLLGDAVQIARSPLDIGAGLVEFIPVELWEGEPRMRFHRFCSYLFHDCASLSRGSRCVLPAIDFGSCSLGTAMPSSVSSDSHRKNEGLRFSREPVDRVRARG